MVKLPDVQALGESPVPQSRAPILSQSNAGVAERAAQQSSPEIDRAIAQTMSVIDKQATLQESSDRLRALREFREKANTETNRVLTQEDIASPQVTQAYGAYMAQLEQEVLKSHGGRPESMAKLGELIFSTKTNLVENVAAKGAEALYKKSVAELGDEANAGAQRIASNPDTWRNEWVSFSQISDDQPLSPENRRAQKSATLGYYAESAATSYILGRRVDDAEDLLGDPEVARAIPEARRARLLRAIEQARKPSDPKDKYITVNGVVLDISGPTPKVVHDQSEKAVTLSSEQSGALGFTPGSIVQRDSSGKLTVVQEPKKDTLQSSTLPPNEVEELGFPSGSIVQKDSSGKLTVVQKAEKDEPTPLQKDAMASGLKPGTPEFATFIRDVRLKPGITIDQKGESTMVGELGRLSAKNVGELNEDAHRAISDLTEINRAQEALATGQFKTGTFGEFRAEVARFMEFIGAPPEIIKEIGEAKTAEIFDSAVKRLAVNEVPKMARTLVAGLKLVQDSLPKLSYTDQGNKVLLAVFKRMANRRVQIAKLANNIAADETVSPRRFQGELLNAMEALEKEDPVINAEMVTMIREATKAAPNSIAERFRDAASSTSGPQTISTRQEYDALPSGAEFTWGPSGRKAKKP